MSDLQKAIAGFQRDLQLRNIMYPNQIKFLLETVEELARRTEAIDEMANRLDRQIEALKAQVSPPAADKIKEEIK